MSFLALSNLFPNLNNSHFEVTSPPSTEYNCIAWAAKDDESWWWPDPYYDYFWPEEAPRRETIDAFIEAYRTIGYELCDDGDFEPGYEKIAIYVNEFGKPTHASRQINENQWTSKLGKSYDVSHSKYGVSAGAYGEIRVFMKKNYDSK